MNLLPQNHLKDFQRATVDYVFARFLDSKTPCSRFLVADEVGLGKTLVARGIVEKFIDYFKRHNRPGIKIVYVCSNQAIASQNLARLNPEGESAVSAVKRINDLATQQTDMEEPSYLNLVALSPGTSFQLSSGGGLARERAILFHLLSEHESFLPFATELQEILRLDVGTTNWDTLCESVEIREEIRSRFCNAFDQESESRQEWQQACISYKTKKQAPKGIRAMIGRLRRLLASECVRDLKPDLIILDEFQRFRSLLDEQDDSDVRAITEHLFRGELTKVLLLSATPYRMFTLQEDDEGGDNHFADFDFVVRFLMNDPDRYATFKTAWQEYSSSLLGLQEYDPSTIANRKKQVEEMLRSVIARTERISVSDDHNTMLRLKDCNVLSVTQDDIRNFLAVDALATKLDGVDSPVEYCMSSAFPLSFMEGYHLHEQARRALERGNAEFKSALSRNRSVFLPVEAMDRYEELGSPNAKLTYLLQDMVHNGGSDLLWIPPSLPYYSFDLAFRHNQDFSKSMVFSSWRMVPKMIAALSSYECERLTIGYAGNSPKREERASQKYFQTGSDRHPRARLQFRIEGNQLSSLAQYALLYPCLSLAELWSPFADMSLSLPELVRSIVAKVEALRAAIDSDRYITDRNKGEDDRWALVFMLLMDKRQKRETVRTIRDLYNANSEGVWQPEDPGASKYFERIFHEILFEDTSLKHLHDLKLGRPPKDIVTQLAYLAIASPAICSLRTLSAHGGNHPGVVFFGAFRIAEGFRKFFNIPENIAVIDKYQRFDTYWKNVLSYAACGNFQSMLDEFAYALLDHNALWESDATTRLGNLISCIVDNIGLRTVSITAHTYDSFRAGSQPRHLRCHFGVALSQSFESEGELVRADSVRAAFNSPFRPFILATTSIGQEGLDFHLYCRKVLHWNLPANPVDMEQREGRVNRFKNLAVRSNIAARYGGALGDANSATVWPQLYALAAETEKGNKSDLVPYWHVEPRNSVIERQVPLMPYSKDVVLT